MGSVAGGVALEHSGVGSAFLLAAAMSAAAAIGLAVSRGHARRPRSEPRPVPSFARSITLIARNRSVAVIALVVIVGEVFGFSSLTVFPTFARDVLHSDATGLGALSAARNLGAIAGLVLLARLGLGGRGGRLILLATLGFGLGLVGFALSTSFALSLVLSLAVGASAAALDTLAQSLLQQSVDDAERGSAMGIWFFAIGFGPLGHLGIGAAAQCDRRPDRAGDQRQPAGPAGRRPVGRSLDPADRLGRIRPILRIRPGPTQHGLTRGWALRSWAR